VLEDAAGDYELAAGRAIDEIVERGARRAEKLLQRFATGRERGEDEPAIDADARYRIQPHVGELARRIARRERRGFQCAGAVVAPAVIGTHEVLDVPAAFRADHGAAVRAPIDEDAH